MRKLLLNLGALAVIGTGGVYFAQAQSVPDTTTQACYINGSVCSDGANCCVKGGTCYNNCPASVEIGN